ncbi:MAG: stage II sporulation protein R, partial [Ruminococcus sp.]|nr:stage II sporulation protein R [Ruminococcus sp.]
MKILFKSLCVSVVLTLVFSFIPFEGECRDISSNVLRVHILANSDSEEDQRLKLKVRDALITKSEMLFADAHSKEEAIAVTSENLPELLNTAKSVICSEGYDYDVSARIANIYFDTRYYEDVT